MKVISAIYGGYDTLHLQASHPDVEYVCYTDDLHLANPGGWTIIVEDLGFAHPRVAAKWRKCNPPDGDRSVWMDGSVVILNPEFFDHLNDILDHADIALMPHPDRDNIRDEADASLDQESRKYGGLPLHKQVDRYLERKDVKGLYQTTVFARNHTASVLQLGGAWFAHCDLLTYQDQLSLPILLDDYQIKVGEILGTPYQNSWWKWHMHDKAD